MRKAYEYGQIISAIDPDNQSAGTVTGDWVKADKFSRYFAVFQCGALTTNNTTDFTIQQATDGSGTSAKALKSATQLTEAGTDSDKQVILSFEPSELDLAGGFFWVAIRAVTATAAGYVSAVLLGLDPIYGYNTANDLASVDEIV